MRPGGIGQYTCDGVTVEVETSTCAHCQRVTEIPSRRRVMDVTDICRLCMRLVCLGCAGKPCVPHMRRVEAAEREHYRREQFRKMV